MPFVKSICEICNKVFSSKSKLSDHLKEDHNISKTKYYDLCHHTNSVCMKCGKEAYSKTYFSEPKKYCLEHASEFGSSWTVWHYLAKGYTEEEAKKIIFDLQAKNSYNANKKYSKEILISEGMSEEEAEEVVKWRLSKNPRRKEHYSSEEEYRSEIDRFTQAQKDTFSKNVKGYYSCWSKNFYKYEGLSNEEKEDEIHKVFFCKENPNLTELDFKERSNACVEFYLKRGMSLKEALDAQRKRQSTFSLKKCIEKYGEEEGTKRFEERQRKWKESLDKNPENKIKMKEGQIKGLLASSTGYSKIAMNMFRDILENIDLQMFHVFYKDPENRKVRTLCLD